MPNHKAELILNAIRYASATYKPCMTCRFSYFGPSSDCLTMTPSKSEWGWCKNVPIGHMPRPVDEIDTCEAWTPRERKP